MSITKIMYLILGIVLATKTLELATEMFRTKLSINNCKKNSNKSSLKRKNRVLLFVLCIILFADILFIYGIHMI